MSVFWTWNGLKRNAPGVILFIGAFATMIMSAANKWANDASPIRSVDTFDANVESVQLDHGRGIYLVSIENGSSVLIDDDRPHLIGSRTSIERVTRDNGFVFYRFVS
ncbi:hypothetical protein EOD10_16870 [Mesorhizobium sp. M7A.T.Ca.TU.009.01.3.2]|nr:hypothetical protein EOD10_16870 [Mesorhizobium sp. M7A.T.Ca.TU.009.01.3.2]RUU91530.1 hypothetical protein EOD00_29590 [Mesorhizobium sp. M7A.T.Ca.TU.009.01.3.1]